jgi:hypothetical protein
VTRPPEPDVTRPGTSGDAAAAAGERELAALLDDAAVADAVRVRRAAREGRDRARETATWTGTLRDLAERGAGVRVRTAEVAVVGVLDGLAEDHLVLRGPDGAIVVVARAATTGVHHLEDPVAAAGDRRPPSGTTLSEVLDRWREDGAPLHLVTRGGDTERGRLLSVGDDVVSLTTTAGVLHVPIDAIVTVTLRPG